jgi:hypothetical protein
VSQVVTVAPPLELLACVDGACVQVDRAPALAEGLAAAEASVQDQLQDGVELPQVLRADAAHIEERLCLRWRWHLMLPRIRSRDGELHRRIHAQQAATDRQRSHAVQERPAGGRGGDRAGVRQLVDAALGVVVAEPIRRRREPSGQNGLRRDRTPTKTLSLRHSAASGSWTRIGRWVGMSPSNIWPHP